MFRVGSRILGIRNATAISVVQSGNASSYVWEAQLIDLRWETQGSAGGILRKAEVW